MSFLVAKTGSSDSNCVSLEQEHICFEEQCVMWTSLPPELAPALAARSPSRLCSKNLLVESVGLSTVL